MYSFVVCKVVDFEDTDDDTKAISKQSFNFELMLAGDRVAESRLGKCNLYF